MANIKVLPDRVPLQLPPKFLRASAEAIHDMSSWSFFLNLLNFHCFVNCLSILYFFDKQKSTLRIKFL